MSFQFFIILISVIVFFIDIYSEIHIKNHGTFLERIIYLFSIKTLFIFVKFSCLITFIYILFRIRETNKISNYIENSIINISWENWYLYLVAPFTFYLLTILSYPKNIHNKFSWIDFSNKRLEYFIISLKYLIIRGLFFSICFIVFKFVFDLILQLHDYFTYHELSLFDFLDLDPNDIDNYYKGVYFSLVLTIFVFFLFNNTFIKKNSNSWYFREIKYDYFKYFFISVMLALGLFFGFFSIFNGIYNLINGEVSEWITKENVLGILPIRLSSLLILYYLLTYIYSEVLHKKLLHFFILGILPIRTVPNYSETIRLNNRETLFFSQISFYILSIALAEFFIIINFKSIYLSILNFAILFILDDFKIINDYSSGLMNVMKSHFLRIFVFNIIMLITIIVLLVNIEYYILLFLYLLVFSILSWFYIKNIDLISFKENRHFW